MHWAQVILYTALLAIYTRNAAAQVLCDIPCFNPDGMYAHPTDCAKFCHCSYGTAYEKVCPGNLLYNDLMKACDWPENVDCASSVTTAGSPSDTTPMGSTTPIQTPGTTTNKRVVCYYTNWSQYQVGFFPKHINPDLCTHILFAFARITKMGQHYTLATYEWNDAEMYERIIQLKAQKSSLKVMLAVGGYGHGGDIFADATKNTEIRAAFINNIVGFVRKHNFDGLDIDWEYPDSSTKQQFAALLQETRRAFEDDALDTGRERLLLSAALAAGGWVIHTAYEMPVLTRCLDFFNLMTYDYHGEWNVPQSIGHHSALYGSTIDWTSNIDWTVRQYLDLGVPASQLVVGVPMYGRNFTLADPNAHSMGDSFVLDPEQRSAMFYYEVCQKRKLTNWNERMHPEHQVPYGWYGDKWVGFDNVNSVMLKAQYVCSHGLGGIMIWSLDMDDFTGSFCGEGKYPLLTQINVGLNTCSGAP